MPIEPFTPTNILFIIKEKLDIENDKDFILHLDKLLNRLRYTAPEMTDHIFWGKSIKTNGLHEIFNIFLTEDHKKFDELNKIWDEVVERYSKHGFKSVTGGTETT